MLKFEMTEEIRRQVSKDGRPFEKQVGYVTLPGERYPVRCEVFVPSSGPYKPGEYILGPQSFSVGRWGDLFVQPRLVPTPATVKAAAG